MSFWNKNKLPSEYKDMTEDQISELLTKGKTAQETLTAKEAEAKAEKEKADKLAADLAAEKKRSTDLATALAGKSEKDGGKTTTVNESPTGPPTPEEWLVDPNGSYQRANAATQAVALHGAIMAAKILADQWIRRQGPVNARLWNKYQAEVETVVNGLPPEQRIIPQTWINQFTFVKGMHLDDIAKDVQANGDAFFSETATQTGGGLPRGGAEHANDKLTDQEAAIAKKYGITPEKYLERKKSIQVVPG